MSEAIDVSKLSPEDANFLAKYGRLPPKKKKAGPMARLAGGERKFFDSADHALASSGVKEVDTGHVIATASNIPKQKQSPRPSSIHHDNTKDSLKDGEKPEDDGSEEQ
eukprot:m.33099 g.33099  ORF g.33099 m.33099 type:complete len:108 (+) comp10983_c0_seq1:158-481(+)